MTRELHRKLSTCAFIRSESDKSPGLNFFGQHVLIDTMRAQGFHQDKVASFVESGNKRDHTQASNVRHQQRAVGDVARCVSQCADYFVASKRSGLLGLDCVRTVSCAWNTWNAGLPHSINRDFFDSDTVAAAATSWQI